MASGAGSRGTDPAAAIVKVVWTTPAVRDVAAHVAYLGEVNPIAARELSIALFTAGDSLSSLCHRGRPGRIQGTRDLVCVYPYVISYRVRQDAVVILRVWHGKLLT